MNKDNDKDTDTDKEKDKDSGNGKDNNHNRNEGSKGNRAVRPRAKPGLRRQWPMARRILAMISYFVDWVYLQTLRFAFIFPPVNSRSGSVEGTAHWFRQFMYCKKRPNVWRAACAPLPSPPPCEGRQWHPLRSGYVCWIMFSDVYGVCVTTYHSQLLFRPKCLHLGVLICALCS